MTGDPWVDGAILARGAPSSKDRCRINVTRAPQALAEQLRERVRTLGLQAEYKEFVDQHGQPFLHLIVDHFDAVFGDLPPYRARRVPEAAPYDFRVGYIQFSARPHGRAKSLDDPISLRIHPMRDGPPPQDVLEALHHLGVEGYEEWNGKIILKPEMFAGVVSLEQVASMFRAEQVADAAQTAEMVEAAADRVQARHAAADRIRAADLIAHKLSVLKAFTERLQAGPLPEVQSDDIRGWGRKDRLILQDLLALEGYRSGARVGITTDALQHLERRYHELLTALFWRSAEGAEVRGRLVGAPSPREPQRISDFLASMELNGGDGQAAFDKVPDVGLRAVKFFGGLRAATPWAEFDILSQCFRCRKRFVVGIGHSCKECGNSVCAGCGEANPSPILCETHARPGKDKAKPGRRVPGGRGPKAFQESANLTPECKVLAEALQAARIRVFFAKPYRLPKWVSSRLEDAKNQMEKHTNALAVAVLKVNPDVAPGVIRAAALSADSARAKWELVDVRPANSERAFVVLALSARTDGSSGAVGKS